MLDVGDVDLIGGRIDRYGHGARAVDDRHDGAPVVGHTNSIRPTTMA